MTERKLATIRKIDAINPIPEADAIEVATVDGWNVVVKKGEFKVGDYAVYFEIDSWIPNTIAPFLTKPDRDPAVYNEVSGERLKTIKLRKQLSQGLLLPMTTFPELVLCKRQDYNTTGEICVGMKEDDLIYEVDEYNDITEYLGIQKWERALHASLAGTARGNFPSFIYKTDQERVQNLSRRLGEYEGEEFEVSIKLDGSSCTQYFLPEGNKYLKEDEISRFGVCSRNLDLKETEGNSFWTVARVMGMEAKLKTLSPPRALAIQGELIGPTIQGGYEKEPVNRFYVFDIFDIDKQEYLLPAERRELCNSLGITHVPLIGINTKLPIGDNLIPQLLELAEGLGMNNGVKREGIVYKHNKSSFSFKVISNSYLLKNDG